MTYRTTLMAALAGAALFGPQAAADGPAIGQFELKDLEAGPGYLQFQSQNAYSWGQPKREAVLDGAEIVADENSVVRQRHALEMEMGFTRYLKARIGIEFEKERIDDPPTLGAGDEFGNLNLSEIGGELIAVLIPREGDGFGLGAVVEAEHPLDGEPDSLVMGPIFELAQGPWSASFIPMAVHHFGGTSGSDEPRDNKWDFAYAAQVLYAQSSTWSYGIEAYGTIDRIGSTGHIGDAAAHFGDHDQHRAGPIVYYTYALPGPSLRQSMGIKGSDDDGEGEEGPTATLGVGFFAGLNDNTPDGTAKLSLEVDF